MGGGLGGVEERETVVWRLSMRGNKIVLKIQELKEGHGVQIQVTHLFTRSVLSYPYQVKEEGLPEVLFVVTCFYYCFVFCYPYSDHTLLVISDHHHFDTSLM